MTDRLHSCKDSPDGRHTYFQLNEVVLCVHCKRRPDLVRESFRPIVTAPADAHLGAVGGE